MSPENDSPNDEPLPPPPQSESVSSSSQEPASPMSKSATPSVNQSIGSKPNPITGVVVRKPTVATIVILVVGLLIGYGIGASGTSTKEVATPNAANDVAPTEEDVPIVTESPQPLPYVPTKNDFKLTVKILKKECFGSAGCNITYRVQVSYEGQPLNPSETWEVTYEVRGGEDGPVINTFTVNGDQASVDERENLSTSSASSRLSVVVTDVSGPN